MLTKLLPDQISNFWDIIKYAIEHSLPPVIGESEDKMSRILESALSGSIDVWASYNKKDSSTKFEGLVLTKVLHDDSSGTSNLLIYCLYAYRNVDSASWISGLTSILKYAKAKGCNQIVAYTDVPYIVELVRQLGGNTNYTFISFNINETLNRIETIGI